MARDLSPNRSLGRKKQSGLKSSGPKLSSSSQKKAGFIKSPTATSKNVGVVATTGGVATTGAKSGVPGLILATTGAKSGVPGLITPGSRKFPTDISNIGEDVTDGEGFEDTLQHIESEEE